MNNKAIFLLLLLSMNALLVSCNLPQTEQDDISTQTAATIAAIRTQAYLEYLASNATPTAEATKLPPTETSTPTKKPTATHWSDEQDCETQMIVPSWSEREWFIFRNEKLGVEFEYPPPAGIYQYEYANLVCYSQSSDGWLAVSSVFWAFDAGSQSTEERKYFAAAVSSDYTGYSSGRPSEAIRFRRTDGAYYLDFVDGSEFEVEPVKIIKHPHDVYALVYNPLTTMGLAWPDEHVVVILLPEDYRPNFESINIHLGEKLTIKLLEELVNSIRFLDLPDIETPEPGE